MSIRMLVVEDEANIADFLIRGLREEGYVVEHAADGSTAWNALRSGEWDLVLAGLVASRPGWVDPACSGFGSWAVTRPCCS